MTIYEFFLNLSCTLGTEQQIKDLGWLIKLHTNIDVNEWLTREMDKETTEDLAPLINRLLTGEPLAYILGYTDFYFSKIYVDKNVLIPRPETEELCDIIMQQTETKEAKVLDLCTGSGCIAVALAKNNPDWQVTGVDVSENAIQIAKRNAKENEVFVDFVVSDMWQNVEGTFDIIVSNPPYIREKDKKDLPASVIDYEPELALFGGKDGLDFYRNIAENAPKYLNENGWLYLEIGYNQQKDVKKLLKDNFVDIEVRKDVFGKDRFVLARKK